MTDTPPFRDEALTHHRAQRGPGALLAAAPGWTRWLFWVLVVAALGALAAAALVRVDRFAFVAATMRGAEVRALVPAGSARELHPGAAARLIPLGAGARAVRVRVVAVTRAGAPAGSVVVVARAPVALRATAGLLRVRVGRRSLLGDLAPGHTS